MKFPVVILGLVVLVVILGFVIPMARARHEPFVSHTEYVKEGNRRYNPFADNIDTTRPNYVMAETDSELADATKSLYDVMNTAGLETEKDKGTYLGVLRDRVTAQMPPTVKVAADVKKCEALSGRGACSVLGGSEYSKCGVCIKGGTTYDGKNPGKHMGGLFILPEDKQYQIADAKDRGMKVSHSPTVGSCPAGYFYTDKAQCIKEANRLDCAESGATGGFNGVTIDGRSVAAAKCAQAPFSGGNVFIYDPKNRKFNVNLRVLAPTGTGQTRVYVYDTNNRQVGYGVSNTPGNEFLVRVSNVSELQSLRILVALEAPQRSSGNSEVFQYAINEQGKDTVGYNQTVATSAQICARLGVQLATKSQVVDSFNNGAQICSSGWTSDGASIYPIQAGGLVGCGSRGLNEWNAGGMARTWCYGIKPPQSTRQDLFNATVFPFFNTLGSAVTPSQAEQPNQWSQYGDTYQAPFVRGVLLQWEILGETMTRTAGFESSIEAVNQVPTDTATGINRVLRKFGTFKGSSLIKTPKPNSVSKIITTQSWLWSNQSKDQYVRFDVKVPGLFLDPVYPEDASVAYSGPLMTTPETAAFLRVSPCMASGQKAGAYSEECLTDLFTSSGGDPGNGKLATTNGGLAQLNKIGDMDAISNYIDNLYSLATTGRDLNGTMSDMETINDAAQSLFGFDLMTPCETITEDSQGKIMLIQKVGGLGSDCLDYLWMNTGSDQNRGNEPGERKSTLSNTYTSIGERFSGLRKQERTKTARKAHPFQTCQRTGSLAPISASGKENASSIQRINADATAARAKACSGNRNDPRCSTGSSISFVQDIYNSIFQTANAGASSSSSDAQATAISQCYGVKKIPTPTPPSVSLAKGKIVGSVNINTGNYTMSFDITPRGIVGNWGSIIHVTSPANGNCCNPGDRAPGIWFWPGDTSLHIRLGDLTDGNWGVWQTSPLPMNQRTSVRIVANGSTVNVYAGVDSITLTQPTRRPTGNDFKIYMCDPWYDVANAQIDNFNYVVDGVPVNITP